MSKPKKKSEIIDEMSEVAVGKFGQDYTGFKPPPNPVLMKRLKEKQEPESEGT